MTLFNGYHLLGEDHAPNLSPTPTPAATQAMPHDIVRPTSDTDLRAAVHEIRRLLEERTQQWQNAEARAGRGFNILLNLALRLCKTAYDDELRRTGQALAGWTSEHMAAFIERHVQAQLTQATITADPALSQKYLALRAEHQQLREDYQRVVTLRQYETQELLHARSLLERLPSEQRRAQLVVEAAAEATAEIATEAEITLVQVTAATPMLTPVPVEVVEVTPSIPSSPSLTTALHVDVPTTSPAALPTDTPSVNKPMPTHSERVDGVLKFMAVTGLARMSKLRDQLTKTWNLDPKSGTISSALHTAQTNGWVQLQTVRSDLKTKGTPTSQFVWLTPAGEQRARALGAPPIESEVARALRLNLPLEILLLILQAVDVLAKEHYTGLVVLPDPVHLPNGVAYSPSLAAVTPQGERVYLECERAAQDNRPHRWWVAAQANNNTVRLIAPSAPLQQALVNEVNLARASAPVPFRILACNLTDYDQHKRGKEGSLWTYQH